MDRLQCVVEMSILCSHIVMLPHLWSFLSFVVMILKDGSLIFFACFSPMVLREVLTVPGGVL